MSLADIDIFKILFLDIETVPAATSYENLTAEWQALWNKKAQTIKKNNEDTPAELYNQAGIYAEFGKIICISTAIIVEQNQELFIKVKSFFDHDEKKVLLLLARMLNSQKFIDNFVLCAHNGKEFDFPYISRRMIVNNISIPQALNNFSKKPWEIKHLDTMDLWRFGDYKHYTSLDLLANLLNIPTPKQNMNGSQVAEVYYKENNLQKIADYCQNDVATVAQLLLRYKGMKTIPVQNILQF